jgi:hypothetical protein
MACCDNVQNFCVNRGETFNPVLRWGGSTLTSIPITGITQAAPAVVTAAAHGAPDNWPVAVVSAKGMLQINADNFPPEPDEWITADVLSANTLALSTVNSADYSTYTSGGFLVFKTPNSLAALTAQFRIWSDELHTGTPLVTLTVGSGITLDDTAKTITLLLATAGITWDIGYHALDVTVGSVVTRLFEGTFTISE